jgi:hypothetical protein
VGNPFPVLALADMFLTASSYPIAFESAAARIDPYFGFERQVRFLFFFYDLQRF